MKRFFRSFRYGEKGFTLIELLVVVAILGVLAAVAVPNVGKFIGKGKVEALETELHNVQTAVMAMLADSASGELDAGNSGTIDMSLVKATKSTTGDLLLSAYMTGLGTGTDAFKTKAALAQGKVYIFLIDGTVTQADAP